MPHGYELKALIRSRMLSGRLPRSAALQVYSGKGDGHTCACCGKPIAHSQVQYDVESNEIETRSISMHFHCYHAWHEVAVVLQREAHASASASK